MSDSSLSKFLEKILDILNVQGVTIKMFIKEMGEVKIFLNTPYFSTPWIVWGGFDFFWNHQKTKGQQTEFNSSRVLGSGKIMLVKQNNM